MFFTGRQFDAREAARMGLVNRVVADDALEAAVEEMARTIVANAPLTVRCAKLVVGEALKDVAERDVAAAERAVAACFASNDYKEGQAAFMEKRKPRFTGT
jgi:enoyl-CoA hydratase